MAINPLTANQSNVVVRCRSTELDGGGGVFKWVTGDSTTPDYGTILNSTNSTPPPDGRWWRIFSGPLDIRWFGATADDGTDDTDAFDLIANSGRSDVSILVPSGTYTCNTSDFSCNVLIKGEKGAIVTRSQAGTILRFIGVGATVHIEDLEIQGAGMNGNGISGQYLAEFSAERVTVSGCGTVGGANSYNGFSIADVTKAVVRDCKFFDCERDGIIFWPVKDVTVTGSWAQHCGRGGFICDKGETVGPDRVFLQGNTVTNCASIGLYAETGSAQSCDVEISGNNILNCGWGSSTDSWGIAGGAYTKGSIHDNKIISFGVGGSGSSVQIAAILLHNYNGGYNVHDNVITDSRLSSIVVHNPAMSEYTVNIHHNNILNPGSRGIYLELAPYTHLVGNQIWEPTDYGILASYSSATIVSGNTVRKNVNSNLSSGLYVDNSFRLVVVGNDFNGDNMTYGIEVYSSSANCFQELGHNNIQTYTTKWLSSGETSVAGNIENLLKSYIGSGTPESNVTAPIGSIYRNTAGTPTFYVKQSGSGNTGWVAK